MMTVCVYILYIKSNIILDIIERRDNEALKYV